MKNRELTVGQTVGRYRMIESLLGEGGMGRVYLAEDPKLHRKVSLKFLPTNLTQDHERLRRFEQEARAVFAALNHPNIITIHEIGEEDGYQFIATEFIEGQTLRQRLSSPVDLDEALEMRYSNRISPRCSAPRKHHSSRHQAREHHDPQG